MPAHVLEEKTQGQFFLCVCAFVVECVTCVFAQNFYETGGLNQSRFLLFRYKAFL